MERFFQSRRAILRGTAAMAAATGLEALSMRRAAAQSQGFAMAPATQDVTPFTVHVPQAALDDLKHRLAQTRWPDRETVADDSQGARLDKVKALVDYWRNGYDWRAAEARLNAFPQFRTAIDGLGIHFLHVRSRHENALPIILTHGWPGSVFEFLKIIGPLVDPTAHGGKAEDAFHVVVPSLPGYGFSDKPTATGWGLPRIARAWAGLMQRLGYTRWVAQGGDWGAGITTWLAKQRPPGLIGVHLNLPILFPPPIEGTPTAEEQASIAQLVAFDAHNSGYAKIQGTRPQTLGYVLTDSPAGLAAWIFEKFTEWTDSGHAPETVLSRDDMLDDITLYWLTETAASSARLYAESFATDFSRQALDIPVAVSVFPGELYRPLKVWGERTYSKLIYWNDAPRGGHFAAFEQPEIFVSELRAGLSTLR